jgi:hypothetical protein
VGPGSTHPVPPSASTHHPAPPSTTCELQLQLTAQEAHRLPLVVPRLLSVLPPLLVLPTPPKLMHSLLAPRPCLSRLARF